jgi:N-acetyl-anhydromuramyl-L-alanine amidase AmpD
VTYPFIQATHFTAGRNGKTPRIIVFHTMETPETSGRAKQVAVWFASATAPQASAHYCVDNSEIIQCVKNEDTAWAVDDFDLNQQSISIELAGAASQNTAQWHDTYSAAEFAKLVELSKALATKYGIPAIHLTAEQILDGKTKGYAYHADITAAKKIAGGHTDPGKSFPVDEFLKAVTK